MSPNTSARSLFELNRVVLFVEMNNTKTTKEFCIIAWTADTHKILGEFSWKTADGNPEEAAKKLSDLLSLSGTFVGKEISIKRMNRFVSKYGFDGIQEDYIYVPLMKFKDINAQDRLHNAIVYINAFFKKNPNLDVFSS